MGQKLFKCRCSPQQGGIWEQRRPLGGLGVHRDPRSRRRYGGGLRLGSLAGLSCPDHLTTTRSPARSEPQPPHCNPGKTLPALQGYEDGLAERLGEALHTQLMRRPTVGWMGDSG